jgi:Pregnancy-associated plasma protein-A
MLVMLAALAARLGRCTPESERSLARQAEPADAAIARASRPRRAGRPDRARSPRGAECAPGAFQRCHQGDVWSEDSCGRLESKLDECGVQLCREGACEEPDAEPCREPLEGRCDGATVRLCYAGRALKLSCAEKGMRCRQGDEGAECAPELLREQRCAGPSRCEGGVLVRCEEGEQKRDDCRAQGAVCTSLPGASVPRCVRLVPGGAPADAAACDACGCPPSALGEQRCDGADEDGDSYVDEDLDCGPIPLRAVVVADASGETSFAREEIEAELLQLQRLSTGDEEAPLRFELLDFVVLREPSWLEMSTEEVQRAADDPRLHPAQPSFYVPVLFTDVLMADGQVPRAGASTLPNGFCGGAPRGPGPDVGIVAIAKGRSPTTLMHELGHFLGLCHTHEQSPALSSAVREQGALRACAPLCVSEGDGVCDTPPDPGPDACAYDAACQALCKDGARPETRNLMSYYTLCRGAFSSEQRRLVDHTLALRRGWHACLTRPCACAFEAPECPRGMGCRPHAADLAQGGHCVLAGTRPPGAPCSAHAACSADSLCLEDPSGQGHCVRICAGSAPRCACVPTSLGVQVCREDLGGV